MVSFKWHKDLDVGVEKFNEQHKQLFDVLARIYEAMDNKQDKLVLAGIINDLLKYSKEHLTAEEMCLLKYNYPDYDSHREQHKYFIKKIEQFAEDFNSGKVMLHCEIAVFIKNWVINHISSVDKKYTEFLNSRGVK